MPEKYVGLIRVSTEKQKESRLGLLAGREDVEQYAAARGAELVTILEEVESGGHDNIMDRPTLLKALTLCRRHRATLLIPKVDRLVRSTLVHADIKRSGVPFRAVDMPEANEFTLDILVAVAAYERRQVSDRTRKALAAYKREKLVSKRLQKLYPDGVPPDIVAAVAGKLGSHLVGCHLTPEGRTKGRAKGNARQRREAVEAYADLIDDVKAWRSAGLTLDRIAGRLNEEGQSTRSGKPWTRCHVHRLLARSGEA